MNVVRSSYVSNRFKHALNINFNFAAFFAILTLFLELFSNFSSLATNINAELKAYDMGGYDSAAIK